MSTGAVKANVYLCFVCQYDILCTPSWNTRVMKIFGSNITTKTRVDGSNAASAVAIQNFNSQQKRKTHEA